MRKLLLMVFLPMVLFALEKVNLIKDAGFERNSELWFDRACGESPSDTVIASHYDKDRYYKGNYSGSCDTRNIGEAPAHGDSAYILQALSNPKKPSDLDSLTLLYSITPMDGDPNLALTRVCFAAFYIDAAKINYRIGVYFLYPPGSSPGTLPPMVMMGKQEYERDTSWQIFKANAKADLERLGFGETNNIDSFYLLGYGGSWGGPWAGQKIYWDDIRLTGYADYDVGVKGLISGDSVWKNTGYTPTARIKNFGRKPADSFLVIAIIEGGAGVVYADTLSWSLAADTEDTLSFKEFKPSDAADYTLTVSTLMTPDESDEDDVMSKTLYGTGVVESPIPAGLVFDVSSFTRNTPSSFLVSYSLPAGQQGTISLYDPSGRRIGSLIVTGSGSISLKSNLSSGVYFVKLESGKTSVTKKVVKLR